jgi:hypothetical protein
VRLARVHPPTQDLVKTITLNRKSRLLALLPLLQLMQLMQRPTVRLQLLALLTRLVLALAMELELCL